MGKAACASCGTDCGRVGLALFDIRLIYCVAEKTEGLRCLVMLPTKRCWVVMLTRQDPVFLYFVDTKGPL